MTTPTGLVLGGQKPVLPGLNTLSMPKLVPLKKQLEQAKMEAPTLDEGAADKLRQLSFDAAAFKAAVLARNGFVETKEEDSEAEGKIAALSSSITRWEGYGPNDLEEARSHVFKRLPIFEAARQVARAMGLSDKAAQNLLNPKSAAFQHLGEAIRAGGGVSDKEASRYALALQSGASPQAAAIVEKDPDIGNATTWGIGGRALAGAFSPASIARHILMADRRADDQIGTLEHILDTAGDFAFTMGTAGLGAKAAETAAAAALRGAIEKTAVSQFARGVTERAASRFLGTGLGEGFQRIAATKAGQVAGKGLRMFGDNAVVSAGPAIGQAADLSAKNGKSFWSNLRDIEQEQAVGLIKMHDPRIFFDPNASTAEKVQAALTQGFVGLGAAGKLRGRNGIPPEMARQMLERGEILPGERGSASPLATWRGTLSEASRESLEKQYGVKDGAWTPGAEKKLAQHLGRYLKEGKTPKGVAEAFGGFGDWATGFLESPPDGVSRGRSPEGPASQAGPFSLGAGQLRGYVDFGKNAHPVLSLLRSAANVSTLAHESAHIWRRTLHPEDLAVLEKHYGVEDGSWHPEAEEKFARHFERYLRDGKAPNASLKRIFAQFSGWLTDIYARIKGSPIEEEVHPNIRGVFDRMLTEREGAPATEFEAGGHRDAFRSALMGASREGVATRKQARSMADLWDARAKAWASEAPGRTVEQFYREHAPELRFGAAGEHLPEGALPQYEQMKRGPDLQEFSWEDLAKLNLSTDDPLWVTLYGVDRANRRGYFNPETGATTPLFGGPETGYGDGEYGKVAFTTNSAGEAAKIQKSAKASGGLAFMFARSPLSILSSHNAALVADAEFDAAERNGTLSRKQLIDRIQDAYSELFNGPWGHLKNRYLMPTTIPEFRFGVSRDRMSMPHRNNLVRKIFSKTQSDLPTYTTLADLMTDSRYRDVNNGDILAASYIDPYAPIAQAESLGLSENIPYKKALRGIAYGRTKNANIIKMFPEAFLEAQRRVLADIESSGRDPSKSREGLDYLKTLHLLTSKAGGITNWDLLNMLFEE